MENKLPNNKIGAASPKDNLLTKARKFLTEDIVEITEQQILNMVAYRRSPSPGADATKPKYQLITPTGVIYFKFNLTENEICAEITSYHAAHALDIPAAQTRLALYKDTLGVASWDVGEYTEPCDIESYSIGDFLQLNGFVEMCLFDYLIINEDRHARNWGYTKCGLVPLFDHNVCFGGEVPPKDIHNFFYEATSAFVAAEEYQHQHDLILKELCRREPDKVKAFLKKVEVLPDLNLSILEELYPQAYNILGKLYAARKAYMLQKGREYLV